MSAAVADFDLAPLTACEVAASSREGGRLAFCLWLVAQRFGWQLARSQFPRATFYRYLDVIRRAGLDAPDGKALRLLGPEQHPAVDASPFSQVFRLPGQRFEVIKPIDDDWVPGDRGVVHSVLFRELQWFVQITGERGSTLQGSYTDLELRDFLATIKLICSDVSKQTSAS